MIDLNALPKITFAEKDAETILSELVARYEQYTGTTLYPGDPVRLFLSTIAYELVLQRNAIDFAAKMNLLAYATGDYLDHIGAMLGVSRLTPTAATCMVKFTLSAAQTFAVLIPAGTRVSAGGEVMFAVGETAQIDAGDTSIELACACTSAGAAGNGLVVGQINTLVDPIAYISSISNTTESAGGTDTETDENFRERIQLAPESFSVAGSEGAYIYWARSAHQGIVDVAVLGPNSPEDESGEHTVPAGEVHVFPLLAGGELPDETIIAQVLDTLSDETVRPLTDTVKVIAPTVKQYELNVTYYIDRASATVAAGIQTQAEQAAEDWIAWQQEALGRDINPSELTRRMVNAGVKRVVITSPAYTVVGSYAVAKCLTKSVTFGGLEDG